MRLSSLIAAGLLCTTPAMAQTGAASAGNRAGGLGGLLGGGLPSIGAAGVGNVAGLLGYCVQNNLLGGAAARAPGVAAGAARPTQPRATGAQAVLERLMGRQDVTTSPGFQAGQQGRVQTPNGGVASLDGLRGQVQGQVCNLVLNRARSFL